MPSFCLPAFLGCFAWSFGLITQFIFQSDCCEVPVQLLLVLRPHLAREHLLIEDGCLGLFSGFFDACLHPVLVVTGGLGVGIFEFFLDISPDFAVFEIWIELNDFNHLFFRWAELVEVKAASVESAENDSSEIGRAHV